VTGGVERGLAKQGLTEEQQGRNPAENGEQLERARLEGHRPLHRRTRHARVEEAVAQVPGDPAHARRERRHIGRAVLEAHREFIDPRSKAHAPAVHPVEAWRQVKLSAVHIGSRIRRLADHSNGHERTPARRRRVRVEMDRVGVVPERVVADQPQG